MAKHLHCNFATYIYPENGVWTQENFDQIIAAAQEYPPLRGIQKNELGFTFPLTEEVEKYQIARFKRSQHGYDIRTNGPRHFAGMDHDLCSDELLLRGGHKCIKNVIQLLPKYGATFCQLMTLVHVFQVLGHKLIATRGYDKTMTVKRDSQAMTYYLTIPQMEFLGLPIESA